MQERTSWGALLSPGGEYWWDGSRWLPMYTPDRQHVWDGQGWQPVAAPAPAGAPPVPVTQAPASTAVAAPSIPVAEPATSRPSWLPPGVSPAAHGGISTPAYMAAPATPAPATPARRAGLSPLAALAATLGLVLALAGAAGGVLYYQKVSGQNGLPGQPRGLAAVAVQPQELPGLHRCQGINFDQRGYLKYMQQNHPDQYAAAQANWTKSQSEGLVDAWYVAYANDAANCDKLVLGTGIDGNSRSALNVVFLTQDDASAARAYQQSSLSVPSFVSTQRGTSTGLGSDSTTAYSETGSFKTFLAIWRSGRYASLMSTSGLTQVEARTAAQVVNGRMH